jgi:hypothetical protein
MSFTEGADEDGALEEPRDSNDTGCLFFVLPLAVVLALSGHEIVQVVIG